MKKFSRLGELLNRFERGENLGQFTPVEVDLGPCQTRTFEEKLTRAPLSSRGSAKQHRVKGGDTLTDHFQHYGGIRETVFFTGGRGRDGISNKGRGRDHEGGLPQNIADSRHDNIRLIYLIFLILLNHLIYMRNKGHTSTRLRQSRRSTHHRKSLRATPKTNRPLPNTRGYRTLRNSVQLGGQYERPKKGGDSETEGTTKERGYRIQIEKPGFEGPQSKGLGDVRDRQRE